MSIAVVDAAMVVDLICNFPAAEPFRGALESAETLAAPAHLDAEVLSALGRLARAGWTGSPPVTLSMWPWRCRSTQLSSPLTGAFGEELQGSSPWPNPTTDVGYYLPVGEPMRRIRPTAAFPSSDAGGLAPHLHTLATAT